MHYSRREAFGRPTLVTIGNFLSEMRDFDKSEYYYSLLTYEFENKENRRTVLTESYNCLKLYGYDSNRKKRT